MKLIQIDSRYQYEEKSNVNAWISQIRKGRCLSPDNKVTPSDSCQGYIYADQIDFQQVINTCQKFAFAHKSLVIEYLRQRFITRPLPRTSARGPREGDDKTTKSNLQGIRVVHNSHVIFFFFLPFGQIEKKKKQQTNWNERITIIRVWTIPCAMQRTKPEIFLMV